MASSIPNPFANMQQDHHRQHYSLPQYVLPPPPPPPLPPPLTCSFKNVDLNSYSATLTPNFTFTTSAAHSSPIALLRTTNVLATCLHIKDWLLKTFKHPSLSAPGIVRMECLDLHLLNSAPQKTKGWILLCEDIAHLDGLPVTVLAILIPHDPKVRWFYSVIPLATLLRRLENHALLQPTVKSYDPGTSGHRRFHTYLCENFQKAIPPPHYADYTNALSLTDCRPPILDPDTALERLESNEYLYFAIKNSFDASLDLSDDRYLLELHEAEREVASMANLKCAEYLLLKRYFFKAFFEDIYRSDKKIDPNSSTSTASRHRGQTSGTTRHDTPSEAASRATSPTSQSTPASASAINRNRAGGARAGWRTRVRTDHAHQTWLEKVYEFRTTRAKMLVTAWRVLGFLDEQRYLEWIRAGGMLEEIGRDVEEEWDGDRAVVTLD